MNNTQFDPEAMTRTADWIAAQTETADSPVKLQTVIEPPHGWPTLELSTLWRYRDLLAILVWRDFSVRYRQSVLGSAWAVIRPTLSVLVFTLVFGVVAHLPSDGIPYPLFSLAAMLPWLYFSTALTNATNSVIGSGALLTKVYFPRLILPIASVVVGLADVAIQFVLLIGLMFWFGVVPGFQIMLMPLFLAECVLAALACGLWLTALNVKYRDVGQAVPFLIQTSMYLTPVVYPTSLVPERYRTLYSLNPMVGIIDGFRWSLLGSRAPDFALHSAGMMVLLFLFVTGLYHFRKLERSFADVI